MRVAIYCRVSSEDQADRGTIENQLEFARKYCDLHKL
jgi:site-specific DNA recombinase